jgi:hypothetical protein
MVGKIDPEQDERDAKGVERSAGSRFMAREHAWGVTLLWRWTVYAALSVSRHLSDLVNNKYQEKPGIALGDTGFINIVALKKSASPSALPAPDRAL